MDLVLEYVNKGDVPQLIKKNHNDAGFDIASNEDIEILPHNSRLISTGLYIKIPQGYVGIIKSRSSLSVAYELEVGAGVIDSDYRGEIIVHLYNHGNYAYNLSKGDRIAQLLVIPVVLNSFIEVEKLDETERGEQGFGSTGK